MKKYTLLIVVPALLLVLFFAFAPKDRISSVTESFRRISGNDGQICVDHYRTRFKDSDGVRLVSTETVKGDTWITLKARNAFGVYGEFKGVCRIHGRTVDEMGTDIALLGKMVDLMQECLDVSLSLWDEKAQEFKGKSPACEEEAISQRQHWIVELRNGTIEREFKR